MGTERITSSCCFLFLGLDLGPVAGLEADLQLEVEPLLEALRHFLEAVFDCHWRAVQLEVEAGFVHQSLEAN